MPQEIKEVRILKAIRRAVKFGLGKGVVGTKAEEALAKCATHPDPRARKEAARSSWREDVVKALSKDPVVDVRAAAAKNPLLCKEDQERLAKEGQAAVVEALAENPNLHRSAIEAFFLEGVARFSKGVGALRSVLAMGKRVPEEEFPRLVLLNPKVPGWMRVELLSFDHGHQVPTCALIDYLRNLPALEGPGEAEVFRRAYRWLAGRSAEGQEKEREEVLLKRWGLFSRLATGGEIFQLLDLARARIPIPLLEAIARDAPGILADFLERFRDMPSSWARVLVRYPILARFAVRKVKEVPIEAQEELLKRGELILLWEMAVAGKLERDVAMKLLLLEELRERYLPMAYEILRKYGLPGEGAEELIATLLFEGLRRGDPFWLLEVLENAPLSALEGVPRELLGKVARELLTALHTFPPENRRKAERLLANEFFAESLGVPVEVLGL